jgi:hypothetical protein
LLKELYPYNFHIFPLDLFCMNVYNYSGFPFFWNLLVFPDIIKKNEYIFFLIFVSIF